MQALLLPSNVHSIFLSKRGWLAGYIQLGGTGRTPRDARHGSSYRSWDSEQRNFGHCRTRGRDARWHRSSKVSKKMIYPRERGAKRESKSRPRPGRRLRVVVDEVLAAVGREHALPARRQGRGRRPRLVGWRRAAALAVGGRREHGAPSESRTHISHTCCWPSPRIITKKAFF